MMIGEYLDRLNTGVVAGGVGVEGGRFHEVQYTGINPDGNAEMMRFGYPYFGIEPRIVRGLRMVGVTRRSNLLRRFVEVAPEQIERGDRVVLQDDEGKRLKTTKVEYKYPKNR